MTEVILHEKSFKIVNEIRNLPPTKIYIVLDSNGKKLLLKHCDENICQTINYIIGNPSLCCEINLSYEKNFLLKTKELIGFVKLIDYNSSILLEEYLEPYSIDTIENLKNDFNFLAEQLSKIDNYPNLNPGNIMIRKDSDQQIFPVFTTPREYPSISSRKYFSENPINSLKYCFLELYFREILKSNSSPLELMAGKYKAQLLEMFTEKEANDKLNSYEYLSGIDNHNLYPYWLL